MDAVVVSSTKRAERTSRTPAVVSVVTSDEILARGYTSIAEALRSVPGFYDVYDLVTHNFGVRGVNGGLRASGSVLKVMIDGQPVDFRPNTGNFFGPELIPIHLVERIEVLRGPASALYGANAYLGVVNVITKKGKDFEGIRVGAQGNLVRANPGGGVFGSYGVGSEKFDVLVGASYLDQNRAGLGLPASSRPRSTSGTPLTLSDHNRPLSVLGKASLDKVIGGRIELLATIQSLDADGRFLEYGALATKTRVALLNQNYRLTYTLQLPGKSELSLGGGYFRGTPQSQERLDLNRSDYVLTRRVGVDGVGVFAESRNSIFDRWSLTGGADFSYEFHTLETFDRLYIADVFAVDGTLVKQAGDVELGSAETRAKNFYNVGAYLQNIVDLPADVILTAGLRVDVHNIYGVNVTGRGGIVWAPSQYDFNLKLLYSSSFKPPTAEQLFTAAYGPGDVQGNPALKAQTAHNLDLYAGYRLPGGVGEIGLTGFATYLGQRVEFIERGLFLVAQNVAAQWLAGGELEVRYSPIRPLRLRLSASIARTVVRETDVYLSALPPTTNPGMPLLQAWLAGDYTLPWFGLRASIELGIIGPRESSQSNAIVAGSSYLLPTYLFSVVAVSLPIWRLILDRETHISLRLENPIALKWADPGFVGIDYPNQGLSASLWWVQQL